MTTKISDPPAAGRDAVLRSVLDGPGETDPSLRYAAAEGVGAPDDLRALVEKVHQHAYRVTDEEIAALQAKYGDDQLFEIIVSAALGASRQRLMAGLRALEEA
jgi:alkylhydroperoxidase family enzyme